MIKKIQNKLVTSLLLAAMLIPAFSINAEAAATAPRYDSYFAESGWSIPEFTWDKDGNFCDKSYNNYSGKDEMSKTDPSKSISGEVRHAKSLQRRIYLAQKSAAEADNPALPFIKVSTKDFLCIYGPMYGELSKKHESCYFDSARYAADYPDVVAAVGNTHTALWNHYKNSGIYEGRRGYVVNLYGETTNSRNIYWDLADVWTPQMTDREIVVWVNKWLCDHMVYNGLPNVSSEGHVETGVCGTYASNFWYIMCNLGIPCNTVSCSTLPGYNIHDVSDIRNAHAWNIVYVDGQWKYVDVTWNDGDQPGCVERPDNNRYLLVDSHPLDYRVLSVESCDIIWLTDDIYDVSDPIG
jgi:transglutaminase/protease-like cytokinesis protein 3